MKRIFIASGNAGKLREFASLGEASGVEVSSLPRFGTIAAVLEDSPSFSGNAIKKALHYSRLAPGEIVIADDSGLEVAVLGGAPGIFSARYAEKVGGKPTDDDNNSKLIFELSQRPRAERNARFVCVIAAACNGDLLDTFEGESLGVVLLAPLGSSGFGYDPLFYVPEAGKTFSQMTLEEKAVYSHRSAAFRKFLEWYRNMPEVRTSPL